jgi:hypothetical protein
MQYASVGKPETSNDVLESILSSPHCTAMMDMILLLLKIFHGFGLIH